MLIYIFLIKKAARAKQSTSSSHNSLFPAFYWMNILTFFFTTFLLLIFLNVT